MCEHPRPDTAHVYQNGSKPPQPQPDPAPGQGSAAPHAYPGEDDQPVRPPWRFALCAAFPSYPVGSLDTDGDAAADARDLAGTAEPDDDTRVEVIPLEEIDVLDLEEIVMWGLEASEKTFVHGRHPHTGQWVSGSFASAERARAFFSRVAPLRLVYC